MEWRKGFLSSEDDVTARRSTTQKKKVAEALPDEAFLPAESYDLGDDDEGDAADPRVAVLETSEEAHEYSVDHCRAHCSAYNKGLIKLDPEVTLSFCNDARAVMFNRKIFGHHEGEGKGGRQRAMLLPSGIVMQYLEWGGAALWQGPPWWCHSSLPWPPEVDCPGSWPHDALGASRSAAQGPMGGCGAAVRPGRGRQFPRR